MDTCPCGYYSGCAHECTCRTDKLERWQRKLKRLAVNSDIQVECAEVPYKYMTAKTEYDEHRATRIQRARVFSATNPRNFALTDSGERIREMAVRRLAIPMGELQRIMAVARTIADLDASAIIDVRHIAEAIQYRTVSR